MQSSPAKMGWDDQPLSGDPQYMTVTNWLKAGISLEEIMTTQLRGQAMGQIVHEPETN